ncbi:mannosyltransferase [Allomyces arbusculus]|nr:mannosyltransferase [Allomyces arbusculus]
MKSVAILVLGDIGRSPRVQYHALSLARAGRHVDLLGYVETQPPDFLRHDFITIRAIPALWASPRWLFPIWAPIKVVIQLCSLLWMLLVSIPAPSHLLVQNPPSIPTLIVAQWTCRLRSTKLIIDWHNLGYTILGLKMGPDSMFVQVAKWIEETFGRNAHAHLFVTQAMRDHLAEEWQLTGQKVVLYDRPPTHFAKLDAQERIEFLAELKDQFPDLARFDPSHDHLLVSSTSWTQDEDFSILLEALCLVELDMADAWRGYDSDDDEDRAPRLYVVITGKGPWREHYEDEIQRYGFKHVSILTGWLRAQDYPKLLGSADLGISLHTSSSGLDLPMKVVDMFGCGLPVCAYNFACLGELVTNSTGRTFTTSVELKDHIQKLLRDRALRESMSRHIQEYFATHRWQSEWASKAKGLFDELSEK